VIASELGTILIFNRPKWREISVMTAAVAVSFIPWAIAVATVAGSGSGVSQNIGWIPKPGLASIIQLKLALVDPFYFQASNVDPVSVYRVSVPLLIIAWVALIFWFTDWRTHQRDERRAFEISATFAAIPVFAAFALSWLTPYSIWGTRHLTIVFAPVMIMVSLAVSRLRWSYLKDAAIALLLLFTGYGFVLHALRPSPEYIWCTWEQLAGRIDKKTGVRIYAVEDVIAYHLWFAMRHEPAVTVSKLEAGVPEDKAYFLPRGFAEVPRVRVEEMAENEFWLAYRTNMSPGSTELPSSLKDSYLPEQGEEMTAQNTTALLVHVRKR
jgi:hypothetical protein